MAIRYSEKKMQIKEGEEKIWKTKKKELFKVKNKEAGIGEKTIGYLFRKTSVTKTQTKIER